MINKIGFFLKNIAREMYLFFKGLGSVFKNACQPSYYSEYPRKRFLTRVFNGLSWAFLRRCDNKFYTAYGFDIKNNFSNKKEYVDENKFWAQLKKDNKLNYFSQIPILRDKYCFYSYLSSNRMPTPKVFAIKIGKHYFDADTFEMVDDSFFERKNEFFVKDINGECASYVKHVKDYHDFQESKAFIDKNMINCIFQERLFQNKKMNELYDGSINTLRIVTVNDSKGIRLLSSILRVGTKETGSVDNWAKGGYAVGIDEFGKLRKYGFKKPHFGLKNDRHQDTNFMFDGFEIPFFKEACQICIKAHTLFYTLGSIGWDVAITENGPMIIEGNDNFEISLLQVSNGGLKKQWDNHIRLRLSKK